MPLSDILAAALSRPAGRIVEGPVRTIVTEVLQDHGYAGPAELRALRDSIAAMKDSVLALEQRVEGGEQRVTALQAEVSTLRAAFEAESSALRAALEALRAAQAEAAEAASAPSGAPPVLEVTPILPSAPQAESTPCRVEGCGERAHRTGFCAAHHARWMAGRLSGFVGPEGLIALEGGGVGVLDEVYIGAAYTCTANKRVRVAGRLVKVRHL